MTWSARGCPPSRGFLQSEKLRIRTLFTWSGSGRREQLGETAPAIACPACVVNSKHTSKMVMMLGRPMATRPDPAAFQNLSLVFFKRSTYEIEQTHKTFLFCALRPNGRARRRQGSPTGFGGRAEFVERRLAGLCAAALRSDLFAASALIHGGPRRSARPEQNQPEVSGSARTNTNLAPWYSGNQRRQWQSDTSPPSSSL